MGLGLFGGGVGVARFLIKQGAHVTVTDLRNSAELAQSLKQLEGMPITYKLGGHYEEDFINTDMIIVNPAIPKNSKYLQIARSRHVPLETEINIFFTLCPAPIIGITGSNGKSTTTTLTGLMLQLTLRKTWIGGNIGRSLLADIEGIKSSDIVVLELSSFQLDGLHDLQKSPHISILTNISPNHLDRHPNMEDYIRAKKSVVLYQKRGDYAVLNYDDPELRKWEQDCKGNVLWYSTKYPQENGVFINNNNITLCVNGRQNQWSCVDQIKIPGDHNLHNILAASCAAFIMGAQEDHIYKVVTSFGGLEHRLEFVREVNGVCFYNDSKATTPESAIAAITAFKKPVILIAGGYDKGSSFEEFARVCAGNTKAVILIGKTAGKIKELVTKNKGLLERPLIERANTFQEAFQLACTLAQSGDVVVLSPACASYDMFINYEERGRQFKDMVWAL